MKQIEHNAKSGTAQPLSAGFEPVRGDPNGFLVHRLNHSARTTNTVHFQVYRSFSRSNNNIIECLEGTRFCDLSR